MNSGGFSTPCGDTNVRAAGNKGATRGIGRSVHSRSALPQHLARSICLLRQMGTQRLVYVPAGKMPPVLIFRKKSLRGAQGTQQAPWSCLILKHLLQNDTALCNSRVGNLPEMEVPNSMISRPRNADPLDVPLVSVPSCLFSEFRGLRTAAMVREIVAQRPRLTDQRPLRSPGPRATPCFSVPAPPESRNPRVWGGG